MIKGVASMRRQWAGQGALLALLLQLALPFLTVHQATARPGLDVPFVICTSAGLVWITPDGRPAEDGAPGSDDDETAAHHCPICCAKQLGAAALLPATPPRLFAEPPVGTGIAAAAVPRSWSSAPPLPARGPPIYG